MIPEPLITELRQLEASSLSLSEEFRRAEERLDGLRSRAETLRKSHSNSFFGDHALTYYKGFEQPPRGFDVEWGHLSGFDGEYNPGWVIHSLDYLIEFAYGDLSYDKIESENDELNTKAKEVRDRTLDVLEIAKVNADPALLRIIEDVVRKVPKAFESASAQSYAAEAIRTAPNITRDSRNLHQGIRTPVHVAALAQIHFLSGTSKALTANANSIRRILQAASLAMPTKASTPRADKVFIGHGRSSVWRELQSYLEKDLRLETHEFNSEPVAGTSTQARLDEMLQTSCMAFLVMTAEDELSDGTRRARENVVHEAGLFQGRLGWTKAIVLIEDGCTEFSNLHGINHIKFGKGQITDSFVDVRRSLAREGFVSR
jgi:predicted nucleotide-binding protein